ncbi:MAG: strawberry notch family protein, partial [Lentisphaeria bacterium]|nr:strawberry notch family protein [Lentisphaeria bacterium]
MKVFDGYKLSKIDHIIAAEALKALSDNGRAAIIIGANTEGRGGVGKATLQDHIFMSYLYDKFNVKDNYIVSGDLYRKQGAGYPVRVLTLDGRRTTSENIDHPTDIEIVKDWDTLYNNLKGELGHGTLPETERSDSVDRIGKHPDTQGQNASNGRRHSGGNGSSLDANSVASGENSRSSGVLGERNEQLPKGRGSLGTNQSQGSVLPESAQSGSSVRSGVGNSTGSLPLSSGNAGNTTGNQSDTGRSGSERSGLPVSDGRQSVSSSAPSEGIQVGEERGALNNTYKPASKNPTDQMDVVIPRYMADAVAQALTRLKDKVGDIDAYVQKELAYETPEELYKALADVQIDGVALAIQAIRNHTGFVLGDQTGIGKGRQCAAMIRWAQKHDITPVFFTADQNLFTDMYRDGKDIGNVFNPLIMASEKKAAQITDADGKVIIPLLSARKQDEAFQSLMNDSSKHDVVFTSYSQLSSSRGRQHKILRDLVDNQKCLFIMDEAHKASGDSAVGRFFNGILSNPNVEVLYASATFAKRPDNMSLYFRTNISKALDNAEKLMSVLTRGGVPLQQILSQGLALDGQYTRRERDFTGVTFDMVMAEPIDKETGEVDKIAKADLVTTYNRVAEVLKKLVDYNEAVKKAIKTAHKGDYTTAGQREKLAVEMATFASTSHNFVAQLLLASKCNICVQQAVNTFKKGQKPVIALTNTLEANLKDFVKSAGLAVNDPLPMKFAHILENAVWRMYHFTMKAKTGEKTVITFKPEDYGLGEKHKKILDQIHGLDDVDLPISPIDYIKDQLERNGVRTAEITGRTYTVDYSKAVPVLSKREADDKNKNKIVNDFNSGKIDAVILNSSGSTGLSIQAAAWFKDQRARRMELAQPSLDIAIVMQTLGRINRTGQVVKPSYSFLSSPLNAEKRQFMVLSRKLQSLNVTAGRFWRFSAVFKWRFSDLKTDPPMPLKAHFFFEQLSIIRM